MSNEYVSNEFAPPFDGLNDLPVSVRHNLGLGDNDAHNGNNPFQMGLGFDRHPDYNYDDDLRKEDYGVSELGKIATHDFMPDDPS